MIAEVQQVSQVPIQTELGELCRISALSKKNWESMGAGKTRTDNKGMLMALNLRN